VSFSLSSILTKENKAGNVRMYNVTMRRVHVTIVSAEK